jgi:glycosyltransferase involved in cell wall biosynthesis
MRIAIFYNLQPSGAKRVVYDHTKWLRKLGHTVDVYTISHDDSLFDPETNDTFVYSYSPQTIDFSIIKRFSEDLEMFTTLKTLHKKIAADIDSKNYDIVLVHTDKYTQAPFLLRFLKTKNLYFCLEPLRMVYEYSLRTPNHLSFFNKSYELINRSVRKKIDRENAQAAYATAAISFFGRELMIQAFDLYPKVSYLGIDTSVFKPTNTKKKNQILFVGQKLGVNGYDIALKAHSLIPKEIRPELKVHSWTTNKKDRVTDAELAKEYSQSLMVWSLSTYDTFGLVPLESLACATPVIAFNVAGYRETLLDRKTGYLVDFNEKEIAEKSIELIKNPNLAEKMGIFGKEWVEKNWTWEKKIKDFEKLLKTT